MRIDLDYRTTRCSSNGNIVFGVRVVIEYTGLQALKGFSPYFSFQVF